MDKVSKRLVSPARRVHEFLCPWFKGQHRMCTDTMPHCHSEIIGGRADGVTKIHPRDDVELDLEPKQLFPRQDNSFCHSAVFWEVADNAAKSWEG